MLPGRIKSLDLHSVLKYQALPGTKVFVTHHLHSWEIFLTCSIKIHCLKAQIHSNLWHRSVEQIPRPFTPIQAHLGEPKPCTLKTGSVGEEHWLFSPPYSGWVLLCLPLTYKPLWVLLLSAGVMEHHWQHLSPPPCAGAGQKALTGLTEGPEADLLFCSKVPGLLVLAHSEGLGFCSS